jgi:uncharacterized protein (UPF0248 family)
MTPIHELLNRIRWDPEFGRGHFELAYWDRVDRRELRVPFDRHAFEGGEHFFFTAVTPDGEVHTIPLHRIRSVYRDGVPIWQRQPPAA